MSVRIGDLDGLTSLPIEPLSERFRNEEVLTVLPVRHHMGTRWLNASEAAEAMDAVLGG